MIERVDVSSNVVVLKWIDSSVVHLASTFVDHSLGNQSINPEMVCQTKFLH